MSPFLFYAQQTAVVAGLFGLLFLLVRWMVRQGVALIAQRQGWTDSRMKDVTRRLLRFVPAVAALYLAWALLNS